MNIRKMFALLAGSVGARVAGALIGLSTQIILARLLNPEEVGIIFLTMSMAALLSLGVISGYPSLIMTEYPRLKFQNHNRAIAALHAVALRDWILITLVLVAGLLAALYFLPLDHGLRLALIFGVLSTPGSAMIRYSSALANSLKYFAVTFLPDNIIRPGTFLIFVLVAFGLGYRPSIIVLLWAYILSNALASLLQLPFLGEHRLRLAHLSSWRPDVARILRGRAVAIAIVAAVATSLADIITLLGGFFLMPEEVAQLGVTVRLAAIAGFVIQSAQQFVLPDLTVALAAKDEPGALGILRKLNLMTFVIILAGVVCTVVLGRFVLQIFGPHYVEGYALLVLLMLAQSVRAMSGMNQSLLSISGYQIRTVGACLLSVASLVALWVILQPRYGLVGIGLAVIATEIIWGLMLGLLAQRLLGKRGDFFWLFLHRPATQRT
jgi:O-antigen/teichoic acid export membrane protein